MGYSDFVVFHSGHYAERAKLKAGSEYVHAMERLERLHDSMIEWAVNRSLYVVLLYTDLANALIAGFRSNKTSESMTNYVQGL